jgi:hypothetical protein
MPSRLRPWQVEARVVELVDRVLAGGRIEDDLVECKSQWPDPQNYRSARQLAGHANKAHDEPILWIIGLDEDARTLTQPLPIEVANWWAAMSSRFDQEAPELERHLVVHVGEGEAVTALRFFTDRSPYVITRGGEDGKLEREVPIRAGTGTRSARRDELVRLLIPAVAPPAAQLLSAKVNASYYKADDSQPERTVLSLDAEIFFQQPAMSTSVAMLPAHQMHVRIEPLQRFDFDPLQCQWRLRYLTSDYLTPANQPIVVMAAHGVDQREDGFFITGPGTVNVFGSLSKDGELFYALPGRTGIRIHLSFGVAGIERRISLSAELEPIPRKPGSGRLDWQLNVPPDDPWAETEE